MSTPVVDLTMVNNDGSTTGPTFLLPPPPFEPDSHGSKLLYLLRCGKWRDALFHLHLHPHEAKMAHPRTSWTPLHQLCYSCRNYEPRFSIVTGNDNGEETVPPNLLEIPKRQPRVVTNLLFKLIEAYPDALSETNSWGNTPLHVAVTSAYPECVSCLLKAAEESFGADEARRWKNGMGMTPLEWLCYFHEKTLRACTDGVVQTDAGEEYQCSRGKDRPGTNDRMLREFMQDLQVRQRKRNMASSKNVSNDGGDLGEMMQMDRIVRPLLDVEGEVIGMGADPDVNLEVAGSMYQSFRAFDNLVHGFWDIATILLFDPDTADTDCWCVPSHPHSILCALADLDRPCPAILVEKGMAYFNSWRHFGSHRECYFNQSALDVALFNQGNRSKLLGFLVRSGYAKLVASRFDPWGALPLHTALRSGKLTWHSGAGVKGDDDMHVDGNGNYLCDDSSGIRALFELHKVAVQVMDPESGLLPFMMAAVGSDDGGRSLETDIDSIYSLLRVWPEAIMSQRSSEMAFV